MRRKQYLSSEELRARLGLKPRPEGPHPRGKLWCPYCGQWARFKLPRNGESFYPRSECCGISTEDFYVKTYNKLWGNAKVKG